MSKVRSPFTWPSSPPPHLPPYLQRSNGAAGREVQVLSQVEIISKHGKMPCQKVVVLDPLKIKAALMRIQILCFCFVFTDLREKGGGRRETSIYCSLMYAFLA